MGPMKQLALDIGLAPEPTLARFFVGANAALLQHLRLALESGHSGALRAPVPVYLWGEPGCGKTHLLRAVHEALREQGLSVGWMDASTAHLCDFDERWAAVLMDDVDKTARRYCCEQLKKIGLLSSYDEIGKYMWHGGAHHVGYDVHDVVDALGKPIAPNMVFCVDIGIYAEELGIGFRVEDNCLVTPTGAENLSASVPRTIEDIEAVMAK